MNATKLILPSIFIIAIFALTGCASDGALAPSVSVSTGATLTPSLAPEPPAVEQPTAITTFSPGQKILMAQLTKDAAAATAAAADALWAEARVTEGLLKAGATDTAIWVATATQGARDEQAFQQAQQITRDALTAWKQETWTAAPETQTAVVAAILEENRRGTATTVTQLGIDQRNAAALADEQRRQDIALWLWPTGFVIAIAFVFLYLYIRARQQHMRELAVLLAQAAHQVTGRRDVFVMLKVERGLPVVEYKQLPPGNSNANDLPEPDEFDAQPKPGDIAYNHSGQQTVIRRDRDGQIQLADPRLVSRRRLVLQLLTAAIEKSGPESDRIPPATELDWYPSQWQVAIDALKPNIVARVGRPSETNRAGTFCTPDYPTLRDLYMAVGEKQIQLKV